MRDFRYKTEAEALAVNGSLVPWMMDVTAARQTENHHLPGLTYVPYPRFMTQPTRCKPRGEHHIEYFAILMCSRYLTPVDDYRYVESSRTVLQFLHANFRVLCPPSLQLELMPKFFFRRLLFNSPQSTFSLDCCLAGFLGFR